MGNLRIERSSPSTKKTIEENFDFQLWKSELNSELMSFWKSLDEED